MPIPFQPVYIPLGYGVQLGQGALSMEPPGLHELFNGRIGKDGLIQKRRGYSALSPPEAGVRKLFTHRGVLMAAVGALSADFADTVLKSYDATTNDWVRQGLGGMSGSLTELELSRRGVARDASKTHYNSTSAVAGNYVVTAYNVDDPDGTGPLALYATVQEVADAIAADETGDRTVEDMPVLLSERNITPLSSSDPARYPQCVPVTKDGTNYVFVVYLDPNNNRIRAQEFDDVTQAWNATNHVIATDAASSSMRMDACAIEPGHDPWFVAYSNNTSGITVRRFSGASTTSTHSVTIAETATAIGVYAQGTHLWVVWYNGTNGVRAACYSTATLASVLAATTVDSVTSRAVDYIGVCATAATSEAFVVWSRTSASTVRQRLEFRTVDTTATLGTQLDRSSLMLYSKPWLEGQSLFAVVRYNGGDTVGGAPDLDTSQGFSSLCLMELARASTASATANNQAFRFVGQAQLSLAAAPRDQGHTPRMYDVGTSEVVLLYPSDTDFVIAQERGAGRSWDYPQTGVDLLTWRIVNGYPYDRRWPEAHMARGMLLGGAVPSVFDGQAITEHYFAYPPEGATMSVAGSGGSLSAGDYAAAVVWEYRTAQGDRMLSPPVVCRDSSGNTSITAVSSDKLDVTVPSLMATHKFDTQANNVHLHRAVSLRLYRTKANDDRFYLDPTAVAVDTNNPYSTTFLSVSSTIADSALEENEPLYTTGGELDHYPFPALDDVATHDNRWFGIPSEDPYALVFSCEQELGEVPWHNPAFTLRLDQDGPNIAIASLDDKLVVFKADAVWVVHGRGPARNGTGATYVTQRVASSQGCIERRSVVVTAAGCFFQSRLGLHLLDRGLSVQYIGEPVEKLFDLGYVLTSAVALSDSEEVYWTGVRNSTEYRTVVYNWGKGQWSHDQVSAVETGNLAIASAVYHNGDYYAAPAANEVYKHTGYADPGTNHITLRVITAWIKLAGIIGYQRVRWVGVLGQPEAPFVSQTPFEWKIRLAHNYRRDASASDDTPDFTQSHTFLYAQLSAWEVHDPFARVHVDQQKCISIAVEISDNVDTAGASAPARGPSIAGLSLDVGLKRTMYPSPQINMNQPSGGS